MKVLAFDASTDWLSVAAGDGTTWHVAGEAAGQLHSQRVLPLVQQVLDRAGWRLADLSGVAFGAGPGSFTGVRIACGVAQGLALGAALPVVAVGTLEALAQAACTEAGAQRVLAVLDARMHEVYVAAYQRLDDAWQCVREPAVMAPANVRPTQGAWTGVGDGFNKYPELARQLKLADVCDGVLPSAQAIGELALPRFAAGRGVPARDAMPVYVRDRVALTTVERAAGERLQA